MKIIAEQGNVDYYKHAAQIEIANDNFGLAIQLLALAEIHSDQKL